MEIFINRGKYYRPYVMENAVTMAINGFSMGLETERLRNLSLERNQDFDIISDILLYTQFPTSVSFINITLRSKSHHEILTREFLLKHRSHFSLSIIGNDLKISLANNNISDVPTTPQGSFFNEVIKKDIKFLNTLQKGFNPLGMPMDAFIERYCSNKYRINLPFIVRNSHKLRLYLRENVPCVKFDTNATSVVEEMIWEWLTEKDFEMILCHCLQGLLSNFPNPVDQGTLQSCLNYPNTAIDKRFLRRYSDIFDGGCGVGMQLKCGYKNPFGSSAKQTVNRLDNNTADHFSLSNNTADHFDKLASRSSQRGLASDFGHSVHSLEMKEALKNGRSVIVIGQNESNPLVIVNNNRLDKNTKIKVLSKMMQAINDEIYSSL